MSLHTSAKESRLISELPTSGSSLKFLTCEIYCTYEDDRDDSHNVCEGKQLRKSIPAICTSRRHIMGEERVREGKSYTANQELSWYQLCRHWWHCRLLLPNSTVPPAKRSFEKSWSLVYMVIQGVYFHVLIFHRKNTYGTCTFNIIPPHWWDMPRTI